MNSSFYPCAEIFCFVETIMLTTSATSLKDEKCCNLECETKILCMSPSWEQKLPSYSHLSRERRCPAGSSQRARWQRPPQWVAAPPPPPRGPPLWGGPSARPLWASHRCRIPLSPSAGGWGETGRLPENKRKKMIVLIHLRLTNTRQSPRLWAKGVQVVR